MKNLYYKLDEEKNPVPASIEEVEFGIKVGNDIFTDKQGNEVLVSTVFLPIDHSHSGGKPVLFETMVFGGEEDDYQERYHTWEEALAGHNKKVNELKNPLDLNIIYT